MRFSPAMAPIAPYLPPNPLRPRASGGKGAEGSKWKFLAAIPIPYKNGKPDLAEQQRIAAILDKADSIRRKRQQALRLTDDFLRSVFLYMFGDPVTNPKGWDVASLKSVVGDSFRNGLSPSTRGTVSGNVLTLTAITTSVFNSDYVREAMFDRTPSDNQRVTKNTFLICRGNGNRSMVGIGVFPKVDMLDVAFPDTMIACTVDRTRVDPDYLESIWATDHIRRQIESGTRTTNGTYKVNQALLGSIEFPIPPLETQRNFARVARTTRSGMTRLTQSATDAEGLFASLQQLAFRGKL